MSDTLQIRNKIRWKFISFLNQEQGLQEAKLEKIILDENNHTKKRKHKNIDQHLKNTVENYETTIAHNFNL